MKNSAIVYSTEFGRICPSCGKPAQSCKCKKSRRPDQSSNDKEDSVVRVRREVKGRKGKTVTTISGVRMEQDELRELASDFKRRLGTGGTVKEGIVEIQGDHTAAIIDMLKESGFNVRRAGG
ncbi:translation initiation factor Sui1 [candidate division KSB1 bacterium]